MINTIRPTREEDRAALLAAADLIERVGLHKGEMWPDSVDGVRYDGNCPVCAIGALAVVTGRSHTFGCSTMPGISLLAEYLGMIRTGVVEQVTRWSDDPDRSALDVVSAMRAAAGHAE